MRKRSYTISGIVQLGQGRGGQTGAPTANLDIKLAMAERLPKGLYACTAQVNGDTERGLLYYGHNSLTNRDCLEAHLFDFAEDLYGKQITVTMTKHLRGEKKFHSVAELREQIKKDLAGARRG